MLLDPLEDEDTREVGPVCEAGVVAGVISLSPSTS